MAHSAIMVRRKRSHRVMRGKLSTSIRAGKTVRHRSHMARFRFSYRTLELSPPPIGKLSDDSDLPGDDDVANRRPGGRQFQRGVGASAKPLQTVTNIEIPAFARPGGRFLLQTD